MFSKFSGKTKKPKGGMPESERVFESVHLTADRVGPVLCVTVLGESITEREAGILYDETEAQVDERCTAIVVDLGHVMVMTSAGIGTLVRVHKRISERKGSLVVCGLSEELVELFKLTRMDKLFAVAGNRDDACAGLLR